MRIEFTAADIRRALARAKHRCQAPDCGDTISWAVFDESLALAGVTVRRWGFPSATRVWLDDVASRVREAARTRPRACAPLLRRYRFGEPGLSPLHVDHIVEAADGGPATLANAQVLCIVCHLDKSRERIRTRTRRAPREKTYGLAAAG